MRPQFLAKGLLVQLRHSHPVFVGRQFLGGDVHGDFRQVQVGANASRGGDALGGQHIPDHGGDQLVAVIPYKFKYGVKSMKLSSIEYTWMSLGERYFR